MNGFLYHFTRMGHREKRGLKRRWCQVHAPIQHLLIILSKNILVAGFGCGEIRYGFRVKKRHPMDPMRFTVTGMPFFRAAFSRPVKSVLHFRLSSS